MMRNVSIEYPFMYNTFKIAVQGTIYSKHVVPVHLWKMKNKIPEPSWEGK